MVSRRDSTTSNAGATTKVIAKTPQTTAAAAELKKKIMASGLSSKLEEMKGGREVRKTYGQKPARELFPPKPTGSTST
jgi:hypothetical protein